MSDHLDETGLRAAATAAELDADDARGACLNAEETSLQASGAGSSVERARWSEHLLSCQRCRDQVVLAAELGSIEILAFAPRPDAPLPPETGARLMRISAMVCKGTFDVIETDARLRVGFAAAVRRGTAPPGLSFTCEVANRELQLEILESRNRVNASVTMVGAKPGARASLLVGGRLRSTRPLRGESVTLRGIPDGMVRIRLEEPGAILGHIELELERTP